MIDLYSTRFDLSMINASGAMPASIPIENLLSNPIFFKNEGTVPSFLSKKDPDASPRKRDPKCETGALDQYLYVYHNKAMYFVSGRSVMRLSLLLEDSPHARGVPE